MIFRFVFQARTIALRTVAVFCILLLTGNAMAFAHVDIAGTSDVTLESNGGNSDQGPIPIGHNRHDCHLGNNFSLRDSGTQFVPVVCKGMPFVMATVLIVGQLSSPLLRPPKS